MKQRLKILIGLFFLFLIIVIGLLVYNIKSKYSNRRRSIIPKKDKLVIVSMFKNEAHCIREWLQHYMKQGVTHFYMIDNGSTDDWKNEIKRCSSNSLY